MESCYHTEFEVEVIAADSNDFCVKGAKYTSLPEKSEYKLKLINKGDTKVDADVMLDGKDVGTWRVNPYSSTIIERPANEQRKFVFVSEIGSIARRTGAIAGKGDNGLIKVTFTPEKKVYVTAREITSKVYEPTRRNLKSSGDSFASSKRRTGFASPPRMNLASRNESLGIRNLSPSRAGVTVLGGRSNQSFVSVNTLAEIDYNRITTIMIRLVVKEPEYIGLEDVRRGVYPERL